MKPAEVQKDIIDKYYTYLKSYGYMNDSTAMQTLFTELLLDSFYTFSEYITEDFTRDVAKIFKAMSCCNCLVDYDIFQISYSPVLKAQDHIRAQYIIANPEITITTVDSAYYIVFDGSIYHKYVIPEGTNTLTIDAPANADINFYGNITEFETPSYKGNTPNTLAGIEVKSNYIKKISIETAYDYVSKFFSITDCPNIEYIQIRNTWLAGKVSNISVHEMPKLKHFAVRNSGLRKNFDFSNNPLLKFVALDENWLSYQGNVGKIDLSHSPLLETLYIGVCGVQILNLSTCTNITTLSSYGNNLLHTIYFRAINQSVSNQIKNMISTAYYHGVAGTIYLNPSDPYYQTVADFAVGKGWTVEYIT